MKQTVNFNGFCDAFERMGRNENFSYAGKRALFDYLEEFEQDTGEEIELDIVALCCEYSEYGSAFEAVMEYDTDEGQRMALSVFNDDIELLAKVPGYWEGFVKGMEADYAEWRNNADLTETCISWLNQHTTVIEFDGGVIIQCF